MKKYTPDLSGRDATAVVCLGCWAPLKMSDSIRRCEVRITSVGKAVELVDSISDVCCALLRKVLEGERSLELSEHSGQAAV